MRLTLRELEGNFIKYDGPKSFHTGVSFEEASGVMFLCPLCFKDNNGPVGTHSVICWSRSKGVPDDTSPGPGRWKLDGTSVDDLTLNAEPGQSARSVLLTGGCGWHGFVDNGAVEV